MLALQMILLSRGTTKVLDGELKFKKAAKANKAKEAADDKEASTADADASTEDKDADAADAKKAVAPKPAPTPAPAKPA